MIGDGWTDEPSVRPGPPDPHEPGKRRIAIVTGTRAEFGLLKPVMSAVLARPDCELLVFATGAHLISPAETYRDVKAAFPIAAAIPMQVAGKTGRFADVEALGTGISRFGRALEHFTPDWTVILGDRIEAFAAASAASIGGLAVAHIHGGDRAEGIADEAMRHAITKLAHLHLAASEQSRDRIARMGERTQHIYAVGSPAIDGLSEVPPLPDTTFAELGSPDTLILMHPVGRADEQEEATMTSLIDAALERPQSRILILHPNHDPGRDGIIRAISAAEADPEPSPRLAVRTHLPRATFLSLLKRLALSKGVLVGNSSAALIEAAALKLPAVDIGPRQAGRERAGNVVSGEAPARAIEKARGLTLSSLAHPYGDGRAGPRIAELLAKINPRDPQLLRKHCSY